MDKGPQYGVALLAMLRERGWSQKDLAEKIGRHPSRISGWINGRTPQLSSRLTLAGAFGISIEEFELKARAVSAAAQGESSDQRGVSA